MVLRKIYVNSHLQTLHETIVFLNNHKMFDIGFQDRTGDGPRSRTNFTNEIIVERSGTIHEFFRDSSVQ